MGRRNAGVKFYRLILILSAVFVLSAGLAVWLAGVRSLLPGFMGLLFLTGLYWIVMRYPKRAIYKASAAILGAFYILVAIAVFHTAVRPSSLLWSVLGAVSSIAILGSVNLAMLLGHWYLVVRGMPIEPLKQLTVATLLSAIAKLLVVGAAVLFAGAAGFEHGSVGYRIVISQGVFFWMRVGWGLVAPLALYPMIWGTVKIRSTMAATGILYVAVVAVVIGEVLGTYLSSLEHLPL